MTTPAGKIVPIGISSNKRCRVDGTTVKQLPDEAILRADVDGSAILTIHAPAYRNACSPEMREALLAHLQAALADPGCRFIVLTGAGGQFCSGGRVSPNM